MITEDIPKFYLNIRSFQPKPRMEHFEQHTFKEDINHENGFTRIQPQEYYTLIDNLQRVGNLIPKSKQEFKRVPRQTYKIARPPQGEETSLKYVMLCGAEETKLGDRNE